MLDSRISPYYFNNLTGTKSVILWEGGAMSAVWHLMLQNVVVASGIKPKAIFIFFRNTFLTEPFFRTEGNYRDLLKTFGAENDTAVQEVLRRKGKIKASIQQHIEFLYPVLHNKKKHFLFSVADIMTSLADLCGFSFTLAEVNEFFSQNTLRSIPDDGENNDSNQSFNYDFNDAVKNSFLPYIIGIARKNSIDLIFARVQQRPLYNGPPHQSTELRNYTRELRHYLEKHDCDFFDFTGHPELTLDMYGLGDHIDKNQREKYTGIFVKTVKSLL